MLSWKTAGEPDFDVSDFEGAPEIINMKGDPGNMTLVWSRNLFWESFETLENMDKVVDKLFEKTQQLKTIE